MFMYVRILSLCMLRMSSLARLFHKGNANYSLRNSLNIITIYKL